MELPLYQEHELSTSHNVKTSTTALSTTTMQNNDTLMNNSTLTSAQSFCKANFTDDVILPEDWKGPVQMTYYVCTTAMSCLSVIGSLLILYYYVTLKQLRNKSRQLFVCLTICDLLIAIGNIIGISLMVWDMKSHQLKLNPTVLLCQVQAIVSSVFSVASFFWMIVIGANAYLTVRYNSKILVEKYLWLLHLLCWGFPAMIMGVTIARDRYGYNPCVEEIWYCWVRPKDHDLVYHLIVWQLFTGKAWEFMSYIIVCVLYSVVRYHLHKYTQMKASRLQTSIGAEPGQSSPIPTHSQSYILAKRKLTFIPVIFMLSRVPGTVRFLLLLGRYPTARYIGAVLSPFQGIGDSAQGFFNCLMFISTTPCVRERFPLFNGDVRIDKDVKRNNTKHSQREETSVASSSSDDSSEGQSSPEIPATSASAPNF